LTNHGRGDAAQVLDNPTVTLKVAGSALSLSGSPLLHQVVMLQGHVVAIELLVNPLHTLALSKGSIPELLSRNARALKIATTNHVRKGLIEVVNRLLSRLSKRADHIQRLAKLESPTSDATHARVLNGVRHTLNGGADAGKLGRPPGAH